MTKKGIIGLALLAAVLSPHPARAADPEIPPKQIAIAERHFHDGTEWYREGKFDLAITEYRASYEISKLPELLHNISLCYENLGNIEAAISYEQRYIEAVPKSDFEVIDQANGRIARLRGSAAQPIAKAATPPPERPITSKPEAKPVRQTSNPVRYAPYLAIAGGSLALIAGFACGGLALERASQIRSMQPIARADLDALTAQGQSYNRAAITLDVIGGAIVAGGVVWAIVWSKASPKGR